MNNSLLELLISLFISAILFLVVDKLYVNLWLTRKTLEQAQERHRLRELPQQLFADQLFHAGHLGCRAINDGIEIKTPANIPDSFFIHQHRAVLMMAHELSVHETYNQAITLNHPLPANSLVQPQSLKDKSDWILISDCHNAELVLYGGQSVQAYEPPIYLIPVIIYRWYLNGDILYRQQVYPKISAQPVVDGIESWQWERVDTMLRLRWKVSDTWDEFLFELGNA